MLSSNRARETPHVFLAACMTAFLTCHAVSREITVIHLYIYAIGFVDNGGLKMSCAGR